MQPARLVKLLNQLFSGFDAIVNETGAEKIKTIGDAYMAVAGVPVPGDDHAVVIYETAVKMLQHIAGFNRKYKANLQLRIGIHTGEAVAGVIGREKISYDLWGDAVNIASRMESSGIPGRIQLSDATCRKLAGRYPLEKREPVSIKGKGLMQTWLSVPDLQ